MDAVHEQRRGRGAIEQMLAPSHGAQVREDRADWGVGCTADDGAILQ